MLASQKILNEFYQGLKLLIEFETEQTHGAMSLPFYAINKVVAHFNTALDEGDVIAPFFLHYLADEYPDFIDKSLLPDLSSVPFHKSKAPVWINDYQLFLQLYKEIDQITTPQVIECKNRTQIQLNQKNLKKQLEDIEKRTAYLKDSSILGGILAAKIFERLEEKTKITCLGELSAEALRKSAFNPNVYAMYEYATFLKKQGKPVPSKTQENKLETELRLLAKSNGDINILVDHYSMSNDNRSLSQWLFQSAMHGGKDMAYVMLERYIFDDTMQWSDCISDDDKLVEALKWFNWYNKYSPIADIHANNLKITELALNYLDVIKENKYRASFLCYALDKINQELDEKYKIMPKKEFFNQNIHLLAGLQYFREIIDLTWSLNENKLPLSSSPKMINEMAIILLNRSQYEQSEQLYRQIYALDANNPIYQYNLATILSLQDKNKVEQINLYFDAARQGCGDSVRALLKILVINKDGAVEDLEKFKYMVESYGSDMELPVSAILLTYLIITTIYQKLTNIEMIKWVIIEKDGKEIFDATFITEESSDEEAPSAQSLVEISESSSIDATDIEKITEDKKESSSSAIAASFKLFQPAKNGIKSLDERKERALRKLNKLNSKPIRNLSLDDFIQAQKAYKTLTGEAGGIEISHKGKTSGSRAKIGGKNMHLTHGRDRMSIGAQREIKEEINELCQKSGSSFQ